MERPVGNSGSDLFNDRKVARKLLAWKTQLAEGPGGVTAPSEMT